MFICPKCGFRDEPCWRSAAFKKYAVYCRLDELETWRPDIVEKLKTNKKIENGSYIYHLSSHGYVYRIVKELDVFYGSHGICEKPKDPFQSRLLEVTKK